MNYSRRNFLKAAGSGIAQLFGGQNRKDPDWI